MTRSVTQPAALASGTIAGSDDSAPSSPAPRFAVETTTIGAQALVPGVMPITARDRLAWRAAAPLVPKKPQRGCDHGLFDLNARAQLDLFGAARVPDPTAGDPPPLPLPPADSGGG